jgi:hypothetical protein
VLPNLLDAKRRTVIAQRTAHERVVLIIRDKLGVSLTHTLILRHIFGHKTPVHICDHQPKDVESDGFAAHFVFAPSSAHGKPRAATANGHAATCARQFDSRS